MNLPPGATGTGRELTKEEQRLRGVFVIVVIFVIAAIIANVLFVFLALYSPITRTAFGPGEPGVKFNNWDDSATNVLETIFWIIAALNVATIGGAFIGLNPVANIIVFVVMALLILMNIVIFIIIIIVDIVPCNQVDGGFGNQFGNPCNNIFLCCLPDAFSFDGLGCPNFPNQTCTAGEGRSFSEHPEDHGLTRWPGDINGFFLLRLIVLVAMVIIQIIFGIIACYAFTITRASLQGYLIKDVLSLLGGAGITNRIGGRFVESKRYTITGQQIESSNLPTKKIGGVVYMQVSNKEE